MGPSMKSAEKSKSTTPTITTTMAQVLLTDLSLTSAAETEADVCQLSQGHQTPTLWIRAGDRTHITVK